MKNNRLKKLLRLFLIVTGIFILVAGASVGWIFYQLATDPFNPERSVCCMQFKLLLYENQTDSAYTLITHFRYTDHDSLSYHYTEEQLQTMHVLDEVCPDRFYAQLEPGESSIPDFVPLFEADSFPFPKDFRIEIYRTRDSLLIKELDFDAFIKYASGFSQINDNPLTATGWELILNEEFLRQEAIP